IMPDPSWKKISTGLEADPDDPFLLSSPNYDILADSPIEIGNQDVIRFTAAGVPHEVAIFGGGEYTREGVVEGFTKVIEEQTAVFGENPCERYVFIVHFLASGGGGLEHLNSTTLQFSRGRLGSEKGWASFMGLVAHEYFHLWNVKRLRPIALGPFDYGTENYTHMLWFSEGFTAYYDDWTVRRTGFATPEEYLVTLAGVIGTVENTPGNLVQPVADASFDAWIKYYRPNENSYNTTVSYYSKGAILGLLMDMAIRKSSQGKQTLDDFMRYMYEKYYKQLDRGFKDEEFKKEAIKFAPALDGFFEKYVWGTETIPYNDFFSTVGLKLVDSPAHEDEPYLGASLQRVDQGFVVTRVVRGSAAWKYGLNVNDLIVSANGRRTSDQSDLLQGTSPGDRISVKLVRDGQLRDVELVLGGNPQRSFRFEFLKDATTQQKVNYKNWMGM
ncbi:MAG TPA: PDZ domain-containing protein, partial [Anseongella sp.]